MINSFGSYLVQLLDGREDLNLSTVSAQTVLSSRLFQSTTVRGKKTVPEDGCLGGGIDSKAICNVGRLVVVSFIGPDFSFVLRGTRTLSGGNAAGISPPPQPRPPCT